MKRIFLTSGLVLCMACPAFATNVTGTGNECVVGTLGVSEGDAQLRAIWTAAYATITLDENTVNGGLATPLAAPDPLYAVSGQSAKWVALDNDSNLVDANKKVANQSILTTPPQGKNVNYTNLDYNVPANTSPLNGNNNPTTGTAEPRLFVGFFDSPTDNTNGHQMITDQGVLTPDGAGVTTSGTWYAQYDCATPQLPSPTRDGYSFDGWFDAASGGNNVASDCLTDDVTTAVYAHWTAQPTTITFSCANASATGTATLTGSSSMTVNMDAQGTISQTCSLPGWTFQGWSCTSGALTSDATGQTALNGTIANGTAFYMKSASEVSCTAVYTVKEIDLHWDANDATVFDATTVDDKCTYEQGITLPTQPQRTGYSFGGWEVVTPVPAQNNLVDSPSVP